jgi:fibronectin type 3 domain-containing protein
MEPGSPLVFLGWDPVADRRVAGYRIYRSETGGAWAPIGGSFAPGYVDLAATSGRTYSYAITAYAESGIESPLSQEAKVTVPPLRVYLPLVMRSTGGR